MSSDRAPERLLGRRVMSSDAPGMGHTRGWRGRVGLDDGSSVFVKLASADRADALRKEAAVLAWVAGRRASFAPRLVALEEGDPIALVVEDLSRATWPPPYPADTSPLFDALGEAAATTAPEWLPLLEEWTVTNQPNWAQVLVEPGPFLALAVCSEGWLARNGLPLLEAEQRVDLAGDRLVHNDVYSANLCFPDGRAVFVDWAAAARGNADLDVAFAMLSVMVEGGSLPDRQLLADEAAWAARLAGHNALEAPAPLPEWADPASTMRQEQLGDLHVALRWAARTLGLEPPN